MFEVKKELLQAEVEKDDEQKDKKDDKKETDQVEPPREVWKTTGGNEINEKEFEVILDTMSDLKCEEYLAGKTKKDFTSTTAGRKLWNYYQQKKKQLC